MIYDQDLNTGHAFSSLVAVTVLVPPHSIQAMNLTEP